MGFLEVAFPFIFFSIFAIVIGSFVVSGILKFVRWCKNNASPVIDTDAVVVSKRQNVHRSNDHSYTSHYVTFETEDGNRLEFAVTGGEYGMMTEGDRGLLTFQGTRLKGFRRPI